MLDVFQDLFSYPITGAVGQISCPNDERNYTFHVKNCLGLKCPPNYRTGTPIFSLVATHNQGRREPERAQEYFIAPGPSKQTIFSLNKTLGPGPPIPFRNDRPSPYLERYEKKEKVS